MFTESHDHKLQTNAKLETTLSTAHNKTTTEHSSTPAPKKARGTTTNNESTAVELLP